MVSTVQERELGAGAASVGDGEIFDEVITRSRGEFRHTSSPKITSSSTTPAHDLQSLQSPHVSCSPRLRELRGERSPRVTGRGLQSPRTEEPRLSTLGKSPQN